MAKKANPLSKYQSVLKRIRKEHPKMSFKAAQEKASRAYRSTAKASGNPKSKIKNNQTTGIRSKPDHYRLGSRLTNKNTGIRNNYLATADGQEEMFVASSLKQATGYAEFWKRRHGLRGALKVRLYHTKVSGISKSKSGVSSAIAISRKIDDLEVLLKNTAGTVAKNHVKRLINTQHDKLDQITKRIKSA